MKYYKAEEAHYLVAYFSNVERIDCLFELVGEAGKEPGEGKIGVLCVDRNVLPATVTSLDEVVEGLGLTPIQKVLQDFREG